MPIEIRILGPQDLPLLEAVRPDVFDDPVDGRFAASFLADPRHHLAAALDGEAIVAFASGVHYLHPDKSGPELWINEVGVADGWRRQGLGRAVVEALLAHGRSLGCLEAWVATERDNVAARRLYAACGAREDADDMVLCSFPLTGRA